LLKSQDLYKMPAYPPPPVNTIDWSDIGFRVREGICFEFLMVTPRHRQLHTEIVPSLHGPGA